MAGPVVFGHGLSSNCSAISSARHSTLSLFLRGAMLIFAL